MPVCSRTKSGIILWGKKLIIPGSCRGRNMTVVQMVKKVTETPAWHSPDLVVASVAGLNTIRQYSKGGRTFEKRKNTDVY
jgi:hypothetical protein